MDIGYTDGGSFIGDNIHVHTSPSNFIGKLSSGAVGKRLLITNSKFTTGEFSASSNRFIKPVNAEFVNTEFYCSFDNPTGTTFDALQVTFDQGTADVFDEELIFTRCKFSIDSSITAAYRRSAVTVPSQIQANNNRIVFRDCEIASEFLYGIYGQQGGSFKWDGGKMDASTAFWCDYSGTTRFFTLDVGEIEGSFTTYLKSNTAISATGNTIIHRGTEIDESQNTFDAGGTKDFANVKGGRLIRGAASPVGAQACWNGDRYRLNTLVTGSPA